MYDCPSERPESAVVCKVLPVVVKVLVIALYATPLLVEYLQVAFSSVVREREVEVVPEGNEEEGEPEERTGGVVSQPVVVKVWSEEEAVVFPIGLTDSTR